MQFVAIRGNVTKAPEVKTVNEKKVTQFTLAVNYSLGSKDNATEHTQYFDVSFWEKRAEYAEKLLNKGDEVIIQGGLLHSEQSEPDANGKVHLNQSIKNPDAFYKVTRA